MKQIKCENCGANIYDTICPYCNTKYNLDKKELQESTTQQAVVSLNKINSLERPKINVGIAILLFILYWPIGLIYIANKIQKTKKVG